MKIFLSITLLLTSALSFARAQSPGYDVTSDYLRLTNYRVKVNGQAVMIGGGQCGGRILAFHLPKQGWFVSSLRPITGYEFQKIGKLKGKRLYFPSDNLKYEIINDQPLHSRYQERGVWVLHIPPPFNQEEPTKDTLMSCSTDFAIFLQVHFPKTD